MPTQIGINGFSRMTGLLLLIGWRTSVVAFVYINEAKGASQSFACLMTWVSERGL